MAWPALLVFAPALLLLLVVCAGAGRRILVGQPTARRDIDWPLLIFAAVVAAALVVGWLATTLAITGYFSLPMLALLTAALAALPGGYWWRRRGAGLAPLSPAGWQEFILGVLLLLAALLYARPHEYVLGGNDAGSYVNTANQIARTGSIVAVDDWTAFLSEYRDVTLRAQPAQLLPRYLQFVGWYVDDANPARTVPQFLPFHTALLAVGVGLFGPAGALFVTPLWGVLNIAALYFLGRRLFGKNVALAAATFLTITATQIFFARYPTTEPLTMLLVFTALLAFQVIWDEGAAPWPWGLLGGAALGAALLTRIDLPLVLALFMLGMLVRWWQRRWQPAWTAYAAVVALALLQLAWVVWQINWPYFYNTYTAIGTLVRADAVVVGAIGGCMLLALIIVTVARPAGLVNRVARLTTHPVLRWGLAVAVVLLSLYAYFLRPVLEPPREYRVWPENSVGIVLNGENWVRMGWYLTPLGLLLATVGLALIFVRGALPRMTVVLGVGVLTTLQYLYNILNAHYHIYAMRRYVPIVIPMLLLFAAVGALAFPMVRRRWITYSVRGLCVAGLAAGLLYQARFVLPQQDFAGTLQQVAGLDAALDPDAVVLFAEASGDIFADTFGAPLRSIAGREVATVRAEQPDTAGFLSALLERSGASGKRVQLLATAPVLDAVRENVVLHPTLVYTISSDMLRNIYDGYPAELQPVSYVIEVYDVAPQATAAEQGDVLVDVGTLDAAYLGDGFYGDEPIHGAPSMRWTMPEAQLHLPIPQGSSGQLDVRAMIYRPEGVPAAPVKVSLDGAVLGEFVPTDSWETFSFSATVPVDATPGVARLTFSTAAFVPAAVGAGGDQRELGFLIDWVRWRAQHPN